MGNTRHTCGHVAAGCLTTRTRTRGAATPPSSPATPRPSSTTWTRTQVPRGLGHGVVVSRVTCHVQGSGGTCPPPSPASPRSWRGCWPPRPPRCTGRPARWPGGTSQLRPPAATRCHCTVADTNKIKIQTKVGRWHLMIFYPL